MYSVVFFMFSFVREEQLRSVCSVLLSFHNSVEAFYLIGINTEDIIEHDTGDHHRIVIIIPSG